jgi:uncharacterized LabA/DUF88 family protein
VDAGYLLASVATRLTGTSLRPGVRVDYGKLIACLTRQAEDISGVPLLRVNWYDAAKNAVPDAYQQQIGALPRVKLRLGRVGHNGEQKGVDLRIGLDMVAQARNGAIDVFFLISGDDDLTEAVEEAQVQGVQVIVLAVPDKDGHPHGVSEHLQRASDGVELIAPDALDKAVTRTAAVMVQHLARRAGAGPVPVPTPPHLPMLSAPKPGPSITATPVPPELLTPARASESALAWRSQTGDQAALSGGGPPDNGPPGNGPPGNGQASKAIDSVVSGVVKSFVASASAQEQGDVIKAKPSIPPEIDRALLVDLAHHLGDYDLSDGVRNQLRDHFWDVFEETSAVNA